MAFSNKNSIGLDIGDRSLRLIQLQKYGKKNLLRSFNEVSVPAGVIENGEIKKEKKLIELVNKLVKTTKGKKIVDRHVTAVLPETKTFIKVIDAAIDSETDIKSDTGLQALAEQEIVKHVPLQIEDIYIDWQILKKQETSLTLLVGAVPRTVSDNYLALIEKCQLTPTSLEIEAAAITRSIIAEPEQKKKDQTPAGAKIIIDFGAIRTGLILYDHDTAQFTSSLSISGERITNTISSTLNLDPKKAEEAKVVCGLDPEKCEGALLKVLMQSITALVREIKKAIRYYESNFENPQPVTEILLCGGGANFIMIDQVLSKKLGIPVKLSNPAEHIISKGKITIPDKDLLSFATAIGLALRNLEK